jgi:hypothetical protein
MFIGQDEVAERKVPRRRRVKQAQLGRRRNPIASKSAAERLNYVLQAAGVLYRHYREFGLNEEKAWQSAVADFSLDYGREVEALRHERRLAQQDRE